MERTDLMAEEVSLLAAMEDKTAAPEVMEKRSSRLQTVYKRLIEIDADGAPARAASILAGLSFDDDMQQRATKTFSGGALSSEFVFNIK